MLNVYDFRIDAKATKADMRYWIFIDRDGVEPPAYGELVGMMQYEKQARAAALEIWRLVKNDCHTVYVYNADTAALWNVKDAVVGE